MLPVSESLKSLGIRENDSAFNALALLPEPERRRIISGLTAKQLTDLKWDWRVRARPNQPPPQGDWSRWVLRAGRGFGKLLALDTPIPTPAGWTAMGDIASGDAIFDESGAPCRVAAAHPVEARPESFAMYFSDGSRIDACGEHLWTTWTHAARKAFLRGNAEDTTRFPADWHRWQSRDGIGPRTLTTAAIRETLRHGARGDLNHCIPVAQPLDLPGALLPIAPWTLGYWLGNGSIGEGTLNAGSYHGEFDAAHVEAMLRADGYEAITAHYFDKGSSRVRVLRLGRLDVTRRIVPPEYMRASVAQRLALLRGLMDSDGYPGNDNSYAEFCSITPSLAQQVRELVHSLGERCAFSVGRATLNGVDQGAKYRVTWRPTLF